MQYMACRWRICKDVHYVLYPVSSIKEDHRPGARTPTISHSRVRSLWPSASSEQSTSINPSHILTVGTLVRASASEDKQRISTVVAAPCAGLAPSEHTNITLTYTHCRACPFVAVRNQRTINEHQFLTQPTSRDARSSVRKRRGAVSRPSFNGRSAVSGSSCLYTHNAQTSRAPTASHL